MQNNFLCHMRTDVESLNLVLMSYFYELFVVVKCLPTCSAVCKLSTFSVLFVNFPDLPLFKEDHISLLICTLS